MQERKTEVLRMEHLKKYFTTPKDTLHVVDDVNSSVRTEGILGVAGESRCGKSIMGGAILRLHEPTSGKVYFEGRGILGYNKRQLKDLRKDIQIIFQDLFASLNSRITVSEAIIEPLLVQGICKPNEKAAITQQVEKIINLVGPVKRLINAYPRELNDGRRQRVGVARVLTVNPKFIVCDEPVSALDVSIQAQILNLMQDLQEELNLTYMFITHDLSMVRHFSNDIVVMYLGQIVESAPVKALFEDPMHPYTEALLSTIPVPDPDFEMERIPLKDELASPISPEPGCRFAKHRPYTTEGCISNGMTLKGIGPGHFVSCRMVQGQDQIPEKSKAGACGPVFIESNIGGKKCRKERG